MVVCQQLAYRPARKWVRRLPVAWTGWCRPRLTASANSAVLQTDINNAIAIYESLFTDNINVSILFRYATTAPNGSALASGLLGLSNYPLISPPHAGRASC